MNIEFKFLKESNVSKEEYWTFLEKGYGNQAKHKLEERFPWLDKTDKYRILLAIENGKIIGQACSYEVTAIAEGQEIPLTWGIDNIVLPEARGKGVGKKLQKILHESTPNFSSAWYSWTNGHIKKICGARAFGFNRFPYYGISKFGSIYLEIVLHLIFKKRITIPFKVPNLYYGLFLRKKLKDYILTEIKEFTQEHINFIQDTLIQKYDFYVKRDKEYLKWRYKENPTIKGFHIIEVKKNDVIVAIISFTEPRNRNFVRTLYFGSTILDLFIKDGMSFTKKDALKIVVEYYMRKGIILDGISTIFDIPYFAKINYPRKGIPFLSTYNGEIKKPYISLLDQDMEQI